MQVVESNGFKINLKKSEFGCDTIDYLDFTASAKSVHPKLSQVNAIVNMPKLQDIHQLCSFTGMCNIFRWMMPRYTDLTALLENLKKKSVDLKRDWKKKHDRTFFNLKQVIADDVMTYRINWKKPIYFGSDASNVDISAYVWQLDDDNNKRPIHYWSRTLNSAQKNYPTQEKECLALVEGLKALRVYLVGREFNVYMDHESLKYLMKARYHRTKLMQWALEIQEYSIKDIIHIPGNSNCIPDALSRLPLQSFLNIEESDKFPIFSNVVNNVSVSNIDNNQERDYVVSTVDSISKTVLTRFSLQNIATKQREDVYLKGIIDCLEKTLPTTDVSLNIIYVSLINLLYGMVDYILSPL